MLIVYDICMARVFLSHDCHRDFSALFLFFPFDYANLMCIGF